MSYDNSRQDAIEAEARFLCDRLSEFELHNDHEEMARQFIGHVEPSLARLKILIREQGDG